jgi:hypothetical protein
MIVGLLGAAPVTFAKNPNPGVIPPQARAHGMTYGEWSAKWWQWAVSLPLNHNPLADTADCSTGQLGSVWFLGGSFVSTAAERDCTVPPGKALFFPLVNTECSTLEPDPFHGDNEAELRSCVAKFHFRNVSAEIDGVAVQDLNGYLKDSPLFTFTVPPNNVLGVDAGTGQSVSNGYWLMLAPLSVGEHTIHFGGNILMDEAEPGFTLDITYNLTVEPGKP